MSKSRLSIVSGATDGAAPRDPAPDDYTPPDLDAAVVITLMCLVTRLLREHERFESRLRALEAQQ